MFFLKFLTDQVDPKDTVTRSFIEHMIPAMMEHYAVKSAKGGEHSRDIGLDEQTKRKFEEKDDQSMVSHQLNGIFPTMRLLNLLETEEVGPTPFSDVERQVYILSYLMHDVDKIVNIRGVETKDRNDIERAKDIVAEQLRLCNVEAFFPDFASYLEDITYLVVNTQQMWGTNLNTFLWRFQLPERRLSWLRRLCTYSDHIAYLVSSPSAILSEAGTLPTILAELSDDTLVFSYHQLREVRGLFTNVVNNGMVHLFTDGHEGIWPYLFFSDGVVYIKRKTLAIQLSIEQIVEMVQVRLRGICADTIKQTAPGFKFSIQGIAKHPEYYFEFLTLEEYAQLLALYTIRRTINDVSVIPLGKLREMQTLGEIAPDIRMDFAPDPRIGMIGRFLSVVFKSFLDKLDKKQQALREQVEQEVLKHLELTPYWEQAKTIPNKGGVEYRWFWLGACYLQNHLGILEYEGEGNLAEVFTSTIHIVLQLAGDELRKQMPQKYLNHLTRYLGSIVELPLAIRAGNMLPDFEAEMERYAGSKSKGRKLICTLCNSAYPSEEQTDNAVLFQPWVYKNKLPLYSGKNAGGICAICALELMLRQILQKGQLRLTGAKFEALKTKYLAIYPNFFFTAETGAMVSGILNQLRTINFFTVRRQLEGQDISVSALMHLEAFEASKHTEKPPQVFNYDEEEDNDDLESEEETEETSAEQSDFADRSYIKFEQDSYPGLYFFGMRAGKENDDTSTWAMPAFLALGLPLVTNTKVVISEMVLPLFSSGRDFRETVIFDAAHPYLTRLLKNNRVRVNELLPKLRLLASVYRVNIDTYAKQGKPEWKHLSGIARDLETDPLFLFSYLRKQQRGESLYISEVQQYLHIYEKILEEDLSKIQHCVDLFVEFYRGGYQSHSILKPVDIVAKAIINSPLDIEPEDLLWEI
ncbi:MAG: type I-D CRISPR-associated protein Cas10d/Csc3, partial [Chloroflexota bacterium]|nr:type I-D CRISPR-associated protein Cas10d/Csc3 [Chloroflexota bacterium]